MTARTPVASYRLQLGPRFGFDDAAGVLDHLVSLGVSHVYLSPVAESIPGSEHGYDVVDHTRVREELGGDDGLARFFDAAQSHGLRVLLDHVPNHVSTARAELNPRWWEVLRDGHESPSARWFDVDWSASGGRVVVPVVGSRVDDAAAVGDLVVDGDHLVVHGTRRLPLAAGTAGLPLDELLELQHYVLVWWRNPVRNVRRFFTIDDLVGVRVEDPDVAAAVDTIPTRWRDHPAFGGVRVDHVDGLGDPLAYLSGLRARLGDEPLIVVEKVLERGETLPPAWPVDGTTGYDFVRVVDHALLDPTCGPALDRAWRAVGGPARFDEVADVAKREVLATGLLPDLERAVDAVAVALGDAPRPAVASAVVELTVGLGRYRTYLPDDPAGRAVLVATGELVQDRVDDPDTLARVVDLFVHAASPAAHEARRRWQQLTGPVAAKGVEDRACYRWLRLASLCEVGGDPGSLAWPADDVHDEIEAIARTARAPMLSSSTHDTKRSGDVRARGSALSWFAEAWADRVAARVRVLAQHDPVDVTLSEQTAVTCPGVDEQRLGDYLVKAAREAERAMSWADRDEAVEAGLRALAGATLAAPDLQAWHDRIDPLAVRATVAATVLRFTCPGFPDVYQGTEAFSYRLVDPDNRVAPEWAMLRDVVARARDLDLGGALRADVAAAKAVVVMRLAALRRRRLATFDATPYGPIAAHGSGAPSVLAFSRGGDVAVVVWSALAARPEGRVAVADGHWRDVLRDDVVVEVADGDGIDVELLVGVTGAAVLERIS